MIGPRTRLSGYGSLLVAMITLAIGWPALAAQVPSTGVVVGSVAESDGTPIPGVFVVLEGPAPSHTQRRARADASGNFRFSELVPGTYRLAVELPGLAAPGDVEVVVQAGEQVRSELVLSLFAYDVAVNVVGRDPLTDLPPPGESAGGSMSVDRPVLTALPLAAEQVLEVLPLLPGVVEGPSGLVSIGGSLPTDSAFLFNGADLIDPFSGEYRMQVPLEAVDRVQLYRGAYATTYGDNIGGVVDVTTASAGEQWETEIASVIPRPWFRSGRLSGIRRFNPRLRFAGPLAPGRLYFSQSLEYHINRERIEDVPGERGDHVRHEGWQSLTQIDWRPEAGRHRASLMLLGFPEVEGHAGLSGLRSEESTSSINRDAVALLAEHRYRPDDQIALATTVQINEVGVATRPEGFAGGGLIVHPEGFAGRAFHQQDRATRHWQIRSVLSRSFGGAVPRHLTQVGFEWHGLSTSGAATNGPIEIVGADGTRLERAVFAGAGDLRGSKREFALFVQDRFRPSTRLWLDAGVRLSYDGAVSGARAAPRAGLAWDPFGNTRTLLKLSGGLLYRRVFLGEMLWEQRQSRIRTRYADGEAVSEIFQPRVGKGLRAPRAWVASLEASHRLSDAWTVHARLSARESRDRLIYDLVPGTAVRHDPLLDPLAVVDTLPEDERGALLLGPNGASSYRDLELTAVWRSGRGDQLFFSYVRSRAVGNLNDFTHVAAELPEAVLRSNTHARLPFDAPDRLVLWGRIFLPWDLIVAPNLEWRTGFPWSELAEDGSYAGLPASRRFPHYLQADINVTKGFRIGDRQLRFGLQLRNLTDRFNPRDVIANVASDRFGEFLNSRGLRLRFRSSATF